MKYAIEELERRSRNYAQGHVLKNFSKEIWNAHTYLIEGTYVDVSDEIISELKDCLDCVIKSLNEGTKDLTDWRKRQIKRQEDLESAIKFFRPKNNFKH